MCFWELFWTAFSGIATFLATVVALGIALWEIKFKNINKLKISCDISFYGINTPLATSLFNITVANISLNPITISKIELKTKKDKNTSIIIHKDLIESHSDLQLFPHTLEISKSVDLVLTCKFLMDKINEKKMNKESKIIIYITDTTGKNYSCKTKIKINDLLITYPDYDKINEDSKEISNMRR